MIILTIIFGAKFYYKMISLAPVNFDFQGCNYSALPRLRESLRLHEVK